MLNEPWDSDAKRLEKLRDKLQAMTDQHLLDFGREVRLTCGRRRSAKLALNGDDGIRGSS
jgi:hypothetical protein